MLDVSFEIRTQSKPARAGSFPSRRTTIGGHLASQAIANLAVALFLSFSLHLSFVSYSPTALRLGAGCGISMLVSVLGMRSLGLLVADSFTLQPFTWESVSSDANFL